MKIKLGGEYKHHYFGLGEIISVTPDWFTVIFPNPPGMRQEGTHIVPTMTFARIKQRELV